MSLYIAALNSGSNGNCYYVGNEQEAVFIDAGISCRETELRMKRLGLPMDRIKAIIVSHEHADHITGIKSLVKKYKLPVYITAGTLQSRKLWLEKQFIVPFVSDEIIQIGHLSVKAFSKHHDANDPHSFTVSGNGVTIGVFTDIGQPCDQLIQHFKQCHAAFLETNYDEQMLLNGNYPYVLKNRIRSGKGHLSNVQALEVFTTHRPAFMSHLLPAHLSRDNNSPHLVYEMFRAVAGDTQITVASRDRETEVFHITASAGSVPAAEVAAQRTLQQQLSLF
jgi:phosphoribosyl 1,2-cyclic phosphodiesterase